MSIPLLHAGMALSQRRLVAPIGAAANRFFRCTSGIASLEFVIVLNVMVLFLFGIIGFGMLFYTYNTMENAAREAVRRMSVAEASHAVGSVSCSDSAALVEPREADPGASPPVVGVVGSAEWYACNYLTAEWLDYSVNASESCAAGRTVTVSITTNASDAFMMNFLNIFGSTGLLKAEVTLRKEEACA